MDRYIDRLFNNEMIHHFSAFHLPSSVRLKSIWGCCCAFFGTRKDESFQQVGSCYISIHLLWPLLSYNIRCITSGKVKSSKGLASPRHNLWSLSCHYQCLVLPYQLNLERFASFHSTLYCIPFYLTRA